MHVLQFSFILKHLSNVYVFCRFVSLWGSFEGKKAVECIFCRFLKQFMIERCLSNVCLADLFHFCSFLKQFMMVKNLSNVCFAVFFHHKTPVKCMFCGFVSFWSSFERKKAIKCIFYGFWNSSWCKENCLMYVLMLCQRSK